MQRIQPLTNLILQANWYGNDYGYFYTYIYFYARGLNDGGQETQW